MPPTTGVFEGADEFLHVENVAEQTCVDGATKSQEVAVPATVLVDCDRVAHFGGHGQQFVGIRVLIKIIGKLPARRGHPHHHVVVEKQRRSALQKIVGGWHIKTHQLARHNIVVYPRHRTQIDRAEHRLHLRAVRRRRGRQLGLP